MSKLEDKYINAVGNRCSVGRVGHSEKDAMCYECKVVEAGDAYIKQLKAERNKSQETISSLYSENTLIKAEIARMKESIRWAAWLAKGRDCTDTEAMDWLELVKNNAIKERTGQ